MRSPPEIEAVDGQVAQLVDHVIKQGHVVLRGSGRQEGPRIYEVGTGLRLGSG